MSKILYRQIHQQIDAAEHILLLTDERIDGDTLGSTLGMYHVLLAMGKDVMVYSPKPPAEMFNFLPGVDAIIRDPSIFADDTIELVMIFDCSDGEYIQERDKIPAMKRRVPLISFDHHATNPRYGMVNLIEEDAASTADVVWRFIKHEKLPMNKDAAQCILTGICHDTVAFSTGNTTAACLSAAHELAGHGARLQEIVYHTMMNKSVETLKLWGLAFERLHYNKKFDAMCTAITLADIKRLQVHESETRSLMDFLNVMLDAEDVILILKEQPDGSVKGSLRSHTRDVAKLAQQYGGGGHKNAAGFHIKNAHLQEKDGAWSVVENKA